MKAIVILYDGDVIEDRLLIPITRELIVKTGAKGEMLVNQLNDDEVQKALVKMVSEKIDVEAAMTEKDQAVVTSIEFLKNKYSDLMPASRNNSIKHLEELKIQLAGRIMADRYNSCKEEAEMIHSCIEVLSTITPTRLLNLGLPKMVIETIGLIKSLV